MKISQNPQENTRVRASSYLRPATLLTKRLWHSCFSRNFAKLLRTSIPTEHLRWMLLFLTMTKKYSMWINSNFMGNQSWNKRKHFHLFLILLLKKSRFFNVKFSLWIIFIICSEAADNISALKNFAILRIKKKTPTQVFSCKQLPHDANILIDFFTEHLSLATFILWILWSF